MRSIGLRRGRRFSGGGCGLVSLLALVGTSCQSPAVVIVPPPPPVLSLEAIEEMDWTVEEKPHLEYFFSQYQLYGDAYDLIVERFGIGAQAFEDRR